MSIADKITRLTVARNNIRTSLSSKGVEASDHGFEDFASDIDSITGGGGAAVVRASEMQSINVGPGPDGKWSALTGGLCAMSLLLSAGTYTIIAPSCACVFAVVNSIGAANTQISFSPDYPSRFLTRSFAETTITGQAGKYLVIRADTGENANQAISPTIIHQQ